MIRPAKEADRQAVLELARWFGNSFKEEAFEDTWQRLMDGEKACFLVAEVEGEVRGYLLGYVQPTLFANGPVAYLEQVVVSENTRGKGLGRDLVSRFEDWARRAGCKMVALASRHASDFYKGMGYDGSATHFRKVL